MVVKKEFFVNGNKYSTNNSITISDLLIYLDYNSSLFIVEHNNCICSEKNWASTFIKPLDNIELITIVGGG